MTSWPCVWGVTEEELRPKLAAEAAGGRFSVTQGGFLEGVGKGSLSHGGTGSEGLRSTEQPPSWRRGWGDTGSAVGRSGDPVLHRGVAVTPDAI